MATNIEVAPQSVMINPKQLRPHLHCIYLTGGLPELLRRDFDRNWWETSDRTVKAADRGASVVFNEYYLEPDATLTRHIELQCRADAWRIIRRGIVIVRQPMEVLFRQASDKTLFVAYRPPRSIARELRRISRYGTTVAKRGRKSRKDVR